MSKKTVSGKTTAPEGCIALDDIFDVVAHAPQEIDPSAAKTGFELDTTKRDTRSFVGSYTWKRTETGRAAFTLKTVTVNGREYVQQEEWDRVKATFRPAKTLPNGAGGKNISHPIPPTSEDYVNVMVDANVLEDLRAPRSEKRYWIDLLRLCSRYPTIRLVTPSTVMDFECCGKIPALHGNMAHYSEFDPKLAQHETVRKCLLPFALEGTRIVTDAGGRAERSIAGKNPKFLILHSKAQDDHHAGLSA